ncbi:MAG: cyclopropane-fatty-acyl-phospholipid synthase family protein [Pseudomonadales bacterium]|nr:cyclopropane-fatty-acyl-phospholipid synthase family protein [Pseudomonadales bacterium]
MIDLADLCERGWIPDGLARAGMRRLIRARLRQVSRGDAAARQAAFFASLRRGPIAFATDRANAQHYEVPADFFETVLGPRLKYSCAWYEQPAVDLATAEADMLALTCRRAGVVDGMDLLDLGCGWGSLSLWLAEQYPDSRITAVSNSAGQRQHIEARAAAAGLGNLQVVTADVAEWDTPARFDRVLSVEMFEHMSNYSALLGKVCGWLKPDGRLFTHVFCHRRFGYRYEAGDGWMERYFFTGGIMPREDQFEQFPEEVRVLERWWVNGTHYERTCNDWLQRLDTHRDQVGQVCLETYGAEAATLWLQRWRMFFMACAELFGLDGGSAYGVVHTLMAPADARA